MLSHRTAPRAASPLPFRSPTPSQAPPTSVSPTSESRTRSSSDSTPRAPPRPSLRDQSRATSPMPDTGLLTPTRNRRVGSALPRNVSSPMSSSVASSAMSSSPSLVPLHQIPSRSQSRADTSYPSSTYGTVTSSTAQKSPQKSLRNYDSKHLARELDRLGLLPHLPSSPQFNITHTHSHHLPLPHLGNPLASSSSLSLASQSTPQPPLASMHTPSTPDANPWTSLHVHVLPLFNGEPLRVPIEDLNQLVRTHLHSAVSRSPPRFMQIMENDFNQLVSIGMVTLKAKLAGLEGDKLVARLVEVWGFFWDQVLPYVEGVFLPLQTDPVLLSLQKKKRAPDGVVDSVMPQTTRTDVRRLVLHSFQGHVLDDLYPRLHPYLISKEIERKPQWGPRFQQMLLVLISSASPCPLTAAPTSAHLLLRAFSPSIRPHHAHFPYQSPTTLPSFSSSSSSRPRDRRGRIASKHYVGSFHWGEDDEGQPAVESDVEETPRVGGLALARGAVQLGLGVPGGWGLGLANGEEGRLERVDSRDGEEDEDQLEEDSRDTSTFHSQLVHAGAMPRISEDRIARGADQIGSRRR